MKKVLLDLGMPDTKRGVHEYIAEEMGFPEYYGHNLDALYDMLTSVTAPTANLSQPGMRSRVTA